MVAKLEMPPYDSVNVVNDVIDERVLYKSFYAAIKNDWNFAILNYIESAAEPSAIQSLDIKNYLCIAFIDAEAI